MNNNYNFVQKFHSLVFNTIVTSKYLFDINKLLNYCTYTVLCMLSDTLQLLSRHIDM